MSDFITQLDRHYAAELGCKPEDFYSGNLVVVSNDVSRIRFGKGVPLVLFGLGRENGSALSVHPDLADLARQTLRKIAPTSFDESSCTAIESALSSRVDAAFWFRGRRLYCEPKLFIDRQTGKVLEVSSQDAHGLALRAKWGGEVFGQVVDGRVVAWAAVKPLSGVVWDLSVVTAPDFRGEVLGERRVSGG